MADSENIEIHVISGGRDVIIGDKYRPPPQSTTKHRELYLSNLDNELGKLNLTEEERTSVLGRLRTYPAITTLNPTMLAIVIYMRIHYKIITTTNQGGEVVYIPNQVNIDQAFTNMYSTINRLLSKPKRKKNPSYPLATNTKGKRAVKIDRLKVMRKMDLIRYVLIYINILYET